MEQCCFWSPLKCSLAKAVKALCTAISSPDGLFSAFSVFNDCKRQDVEHGLSAIFEIGDANGKYNAGAS